YNDAQRRELSDQLEAISLKYEESLDLSALSHDAAVKLYVDLDRGWTSTTDYQAMERIKEDTGLRDASSSWTGGLRTGESFKTNEDGTATFSSSATKKHGGFLAWGGHQEKIGSTFKLAADNSIAKIDLKIELVEKSTTKSSFFSNFIQRIDSALGLNLGDLTDYPDNKHDRNVSVECSFGKSDVAKLRGLHPTEIRAALKGSPCSETAVTDFLLELRMAPDGEKRAEVLSRFVNDQGMEGMGALRLILGKPEDSISFNSTNGLLKEMQSQIDATLSVFEGTKITSDMSKKELTMRYEDLNSAEEKVKTMVSAVKHDPFMKDDAKAALELQLEDLLSKLRAAFNPADLSFEERHELISELEAGWTTGEQYEIIDELKYRT
ncbi:MAG: hypothetical protein HOI23_19075, partial [Deltaproteobacteria bacterium]|nr:hypothetical protein [Deltaproteobacteria bacterium]